MAQPAHQGPQKKKPIVPIVIGVVVVAIAVAAYLMLTAKKQVEVPNVVYLSQEDAQKALTDAGFTLGTVTEKDTDEYYDGYVVEQDPAAQSTADEGSAVNVTIAKGLVIPSTITVPDIRGMSIDEAESALMEAGIIPIPGDAVYSDDVEPGKVCNQSIAAGSVIDFGVEKVEKGEFVEVTYNTSLGKEQAAVPDLVGKTIDEARDALNQAGLAIDVNNIYNDDVEQNRVISQNIAKDTKVDKGTVVKLDVSLGKKPVERVRVPSILTYSFDDAKRALESAGLKYTYSGDTAGKVVSVNPIPGTEVDQGSTVTFALQVPTPEPTQNQQQTSNTEGTTQTDTTNNNDQQTSEDTADEPEYLSEDEAKNIAFNALANALGVSEDPESREATLQVGGDAPHYDVAIRMQDYTVYHVTLDAITGDVWSIE